MLNVHPARREDADALLTLVEALADYEKMPRPDDAAKERLIHDGFERTPPRFWVYLAWDEGRPVGYVIALETYSSFLAKPTLYLEDFFVLPEARGRGAGSALFRHAATEAQRRGCGRLEWVCLNWNQLAIDFYEKRGGQHLDDWRYYRLTEEGLHRLTSGEIGEST
jgi:GNAT superfamily N-acetyltransferase